MERKQQTDKQTNQLVSINSTNRSMYCTRDLQPQAQIVKADTFVYSLGPSNGAHADRGQPRIPQKSRHGARGRQEVNKQTDAKW